MEKKLTDTGKDTMTLSLTDIVNRYYSSYEQADISIQEEILADDFTFTSPLDYKLNKTMYLLKCWPYSEKHPVYKLTRVLERDNTVFVTYICRTNKGRAFTNAEVFLFDGDKIIEIDVYFGSFIPG